MDWIVHRTLEKVELACRRAAAGKQVPILIDFANELAKMQEEFHESVEKQARSASHED
jgi:hypothetical protein